MSDGEAGELVRRSERSAMPPWLWAVAVLGCTGAVLAALALAFVMFVAHSLFDHEDHSADAWSVPAGMHVELPASEMLDPASEIVDDAFLDELRQPVERDASEARLDTRLPVLTRLAGIPGEVERRLARSPRWHVHEDRGLRYATRLLPVDGRYRVTLHGHYSSDGGYGASRDTRYTIRLRVVLKGHARAHHNTELPRSAAALIPTEPGQHGATKSRVAIPCGPIVVEVFEESFDLGRSRTLAALETLERELASPLINTEAGPSSPQLVLRNGSQGGIYEMEARIDTDSPGTVHVRAFEVTTGTRLSAERIMQRTQTRVHGDATDGALQTARAQFTIYEGDWGHHYAARIELWFTPDDGAPARKLLERVYRVEGWMH